MKKTLLFLTIILTISIFSNAQEKNSLLSGINLYAIDMGKDYGELFTPDKFYTKDYFNVPLVYINYNRYLLKNFSIGLKFGEGYCSAFTQNHSKIITASTMVVDFNINYSVVNKTHLETSLGLSPTLSTKKINGFGSNEYFYWGGISKGIKLDFNLKYKFANKSFIGFNTNYAYRFRIKTTPYSFGIFYGFNF
ncbi:MAG: hypothetical protein JXL97_13365 [Bacteroidales bacterium]|nr:hypothetical protein [Bacteroidales bacterium]